MTSAPNPADHAWWLASRASGIVAMILMTAAVFLGLTLATRVLKGPGISRWLSAAHEQAALASLVAVALHGVTLLGDPFLKPGVTGIAIPFAGEFKPIWVGIGVVGGYLTAAVALTFYARKRIGVQRWRKIHRLTIVGYAMSVVHTIGAGTDFQPGSWPMLALVAPVGPIAVLFVQRTLASRAPKPRPRPQAAPAHRVPAAWQPETRQPEPQRT